MIKSNEHEKSFADENEVALERSMETSVSEIWPGQG